MVTLHVCIALAALAPLGCWRPWRRDPLPAKRAAGLLIFANLLLINGMLAYLQEAGYLELWLSQWKGGGL